MLLAVAPSAARSLLTATFSPVEAIVPEWTTEEAPRPRTPPRMTSFSVSCMVRFGGGREGGRGRKEGGGGGEFFERGGGALLLPPPPLRRINSYLVPRSSSPSAIVCFSDDDACRGRRLLLLLLLWSGGCRCSCYSCCCCPPSSCSLSRRDRRDGKLRGPHRRRGATFPPGPDRRAERGRLEPPVVAEAQHRRRRDAGVVRGPARRLGVGGADALCCRRRRRCASAIRAALVGGDILRLFLALDHAREAAASLAAHVDLESGPGATSGGHGFPQSDAESPLEGEM